jgi:hypothetical protein
MKKLVFTLAAAGTLLAGGIGIANAQWSLSSGFRGEYDNTAAAESGAYAHDEYAPSCAPVTVRQRINGRIVVRHITRC